MIAYREANAFDLPVFVSLDKELFPYSPWSASQYKEEFSSPTRHFVVAEDADQKIIGYAGVFAPGATEADILTVGVVPDHPQMLEQTLIQAALSADVIVTSGGVSAGDADFTQAMMKKLGDVVFWKIAM